MPLIVMATILYPFVLLAVFAVCDMLRSVFTTTTETPDMTVKQATSVVIGVTLVYLLFVVSVLLKTPRL